MFYFPLLEIRRIQEDRHNHFKKILLEHERATLQLEAQRKDLEQHEKLLKNREALNDREIRRLAHEKKMVILL